MPASTDTFSVLVAATVRAELGRQRKSISALAAAVGLSRQTLSQRVNGAHPFDLDELEKVAHFLETPIDRIIALADASENAQKKPAA